MKNYASIRTQVIHEKSQVSDSPSRLLPLAFGDEKHSHKSSKSSSRDGTGEKKKSNKMASVIPSKDKSLHSQQSSTQGQLSTTTSSSSHLSQISSHHEKNSNSSSNIPQLSSSSSHSLQDPFTDLFGTPIKTRPSPNSINSKLKDNGGSGSGANKSSLSSHKSSTKKISPADNVKSSSDLISKSSTEKAKKHKSNLNGTIINSKDIKIEKDAKPVKDKSLKKQDEIVKVKKEKSINKSSFDGRPTTPNLSATTSATSTTTTTASTTSTKKSSTNLPNTTSVKKEQIDNSVKENVIGSGSKKRKRSRSPPTFPSSTDTTDGKKESESLIKSSSKDGLSEKSHKEKTKKQKASSRDQLSSSATTGSNSNHKVKDVKKESSTSTTISLTNNENTGTTTLEIKSVKKEKTWDSEIKKSRSKEHKSDEIKSSRENVSKDVNKVQVRDKEVLKEKEKEQSGLEKKEKEKSKDKSNKNRDKDKERDKERDREQREKEKKARSRSNEKDAIHDSLFSPAEPITTKYSKVPKDKYLGANLNVNSNNNNLSASVNSLRETSSSPTSIVSGSLTPGGGAYLGAPSSVSSLNGPLTTMIAEMDQESLPVSPLSSCDPPSPLTFGSKDKVTSSDEESNPTMDRNSNNTNTNTNNVNVNSNSTMATNNNNLINSKPFYSSNQRRDNTVRDEPPPLIRNVQSNPEKSKTRDLPTGVTTKKRKETSSSNAKPMEPMDDAMDSQISPKQAISRGQQSTIDYDYISQLKVLHRKINDLRDRETLQRIVDIIEETGLFNMTNSAFDFDLMQLDRNTVRKIRQCLIST